MTQTRDLFFALDWHPLDHPPLPDGEGPVTEPTAAVQLWEREPLFMPRSCRSVPDDGLASMCRIIVAFSATMESVRPIDITQAAQASLSKRAFASFRSGLSKPSVNQP